MNNDPSHTEGNQHTSKSEPSSIPNKLGIVDSAKHNKIFFGILSYLGPLVILPFLIERHDEFVKFHVRQGVILFAAEVLIWILRALFSLTIFYMIIHIAILIFSVIGIINVFEEKKKPLPFIGELAKFLPF